MKIENSHEVFDIRRSDSIFINEIKYFIYFYNEFNLM